ncbi:MAG TPA: NlpC/P60 family protein [Thermoanaerobaculia bacterium]|nr:NlpC/P60 family protein [Thermoanaerobaculia bacterium]
MVGRLLRLLPALLLAAFGAVRPATAQPRRLLLDPLIPLAALSPATSSLPAASGSTAATTAQAAALADVPDPSELSDPTEPLPPPESAPFAAGRDPRFPGAAMPAPAGPGSPASAAPGALGARGLPLDSGEYGVEYEISVRDADSFLGRLATRFKGLVEQAMTYLGTPYRRGGTSRRGVDCSGLVGAVYAQQGLEVPRTAAEQFGEGVPVGETDLRPGDLVFFRDTYKRGISHVGIYLGDGRFIHAAGHRRGVVVSELSRPYYHLRYAGARRLAAEPVTARTDGDDLAAPAAGSTTAAAMIAGPR